MRRSHLALGLVAAVAPAAAYARMIMSAGPPSFQLQGRPLGGLEPAGAQPASLAGSRIAAAGPGALVIDDDSGALILTDAAGKKVAELPIGKHAGLLAYDDAGGVAYVADRMGDRVVAVTVAAAGGAGAGAPLAIAASWHTPAEPYGVALSPDRRTLLVTAIADRALVAFDTSTGRERFRAPLGAEPRGVAISPDGTRALVAYLAEGAVDELDLLDNTAPPFGGAASPGRAELGGGHRASHLALAVDAPGERRPCARCIDDVHAYARAAYAVMFLGDHQAVVPFQRETPVQQSDGGERTGSYGGGADSPIRQELAFLPVDGAAGGAAGGTRAGVEVTARIGQHSPRAIAWDGAHDALYVAGLGTDSVLQVAHASTVGVVGGVETALADDGAPRCGPDGLAVAPGGNLLVWCSFTRSVQRVAFVGADGAMLAEATRTAGPALESSSLSAKQHAGLVLFASATPEVSDQGGLACASCHPDVRADGLSWRIDKRALQTPLLAGRLVGTHPFKWDGGDATLRDSLTSTMKRLGGTGLDRAQTDQLAAYLESVPPVRVPTRDASAVARGEALFDGAATGCRTCHDGAMYTDRQLHKLTGTLLASDTPSLVGLAASAPYFHDGSAATLEALLRDRGAVHGMADTAKLSDGEVRDLVAFLETR